MEAFGSGPIEEDGGGLDALMSSFSATLLSPSPHPPHSSTSNTSPPHNTVILSFVPSTRSPYPPSPHHLTHPNLSPLLLKLHTFLYHAPPCKPCSLHSSPLSPPPQHSEQTTRSSSPTPAPLLSLPTSLLLAPSPPPLPAAPSVPSSPSSPPLPSCPFPPAPPLLPTPPPSSRCSLFQNARGHPHRHRLSEGSRHTQAEFCGGDGQGGGGRR